MAHTPTSTSTPVSTAYQIPQRKDGYVAKPEALKTHMTSEEVRRIFKLRGWESSGADLYFNGNRTTAHPHLHMLLNSKVRPLLERDVRICIGMLAWSAGNGGVNFNSNVSVSDDFVAHGDWATRRTNCNMNAAMQNEVNWIIDYFTAG